MVTLYESLSREDTPPPKYNPSRRINGKFVMVDYEWSRGASVVHAFALGALLWYWDRVLNEPWIHYAVAKRWGLSAYCVRRRLSWLEKAGLVRVTRHAGRSPRYEILPAEGAGNAERKS